MSEFIKTENLTYSYYGEEVENRKFQVCGIDLSIKEGTFTAILGRNGSGKSTLTRLFNGILLPTGGKVYVDGYDTACEETLIELRRRVGLVFQNPDNQIVSNIVEEDVAFAPENLGYPSEEIRRRVDEALKLVGMYEFREHAPHLLSGGQKQRIAIAGVLAMNPKCVIFDEPTAMLDPVGRNNVLEIIEKLRSNGTTVLLITHHMHETITADRLIVVDHGKIILDGTPEEIFKNVEQIRALGLDVPDTVSVMYELNKKGYHFDLTALSVEDCAKQLYEVFK